MWKVVWMATTKAALENLVRDGEAADVTVHGQLSRKRLLSKPEEYNDLRKEWLAKRLQLKRAVSAIPGDQHDPNEKKLKSARAKLFTEWLVATFGKALLRQGSGVLDVAGDEATEAIVDMALSMQKPFAVVPCCVMSRQFPHRRLDGDLVATYNVFVKYLRRKHPQIQATFLPFAGKNQVLYMLPTHYPCT
ncbi:hypothetical protein DYB32_004035 [Aphanomyces invadans]|uniref:Uncharacterized protein n=1 Tax=Aphanomyces invadans TaxID=157072 RepID=A0A418AYU9_9STRA|nr:hypothetical protein DYB32_004035 [Aphanomyces invadans]